MALIIKDHDHIKGLLRLLINKMHLENFIKLYFFLLILKRYLIGSKG